MLTWSSFFSERHSFIFILWSYARAWRKMDKRLVLPNRRYIWTLFVQSTLVWSALSYLWTLRFLHVVSKRRRLTRALTKHTSRVVLHLIRQTDWRLFLLVRRERESSTSYPLNITSFTWIITNHRFLLEWHLFGRCGNYARNNSSVNFFFHQSVPCTRLFLQGVQENSWHWCLLVSWTMLRPLISFTNTMRKRTISHARCTWPRKIYFKTYDTPSDEKSTQSV